MPIKIERVETVYGCEFFTTDQQAHIKAVLYLKKLGITDITAGIVAPLQEVIQEPKVELAILERKYVLYAILRGSVLGYIGTTYQNPPSLRVDQHLKKAKEAAEPFMRWLGDGYEANDISVQYWPLGQVSVSTARNKEQIAIRKLKPLYNRNYNGLALPKVEKPSLFESLNSLE